jgi:hypothetical protein
MQRSVQRFRATIPGAVMLMTAQARVLANLSGFAARAATCFASARCAGADCKAIAPMANAAISLGAPLDWIAATVRPCAADSDYLDEAASIRIAVGTRRRQAEDLAVKVQKQLEAAWAAAGSDDEATQAWAQAVIADCMRALDILNATAYRCRMAERILAWVPARFAAVYEVPETFASRGGLLPYRGRWITGEHPARRTA